MERWNSSLELGVPEMDDAHRQLEELMQVALEAVEKRSVPAVEAVLATYAQVTRAHFAVEEELLRKVGSRDAPAHLAAHAAYLNDIEGARQQFATAGVSAAFSLWFGSRLAPWLRLHIRGLDAQLARRYRAWLEQEATAGEAALVASATPGSGGDRTGTP
jgi:hemerythrin